VDDKLPALLDSPQPLGFLPSRRFWRDPENVRLAAGPILPVAMVALFLVALVLELPWWIEGPGIGAGLLLVLGGVERYIRHVARRRLRSGATQGEFSEDSAPTRSLIE
jgi:hypothetical protein